MTQSEFVQNAPVPSRRPSARPRGVRRPVAAMIAVSMLGLTLAACGSSDDDSGADSTTKVTMANGIRVPLPGHACFSSVPEKLGYFKEEGIDFELLGVDGAVAATQALVAGQVDVLSTSGASLAVAVDKGADIKAFMVDSTANPYVPVAEPDSDIKTLQDYAGKKIGVQSLEGGSPQLLKGILALEGVETDDIEFIPVGTGADAVTALQKNRIDTFQGSTSYYTEMESYGVQLDPVPSEVSDSLSFSIVFAAPSKLFKDDPDLLIGLGRAIRKGFEFCSLNPEEAVRIHWEVYPESKPTGLSDKEALERGVTSLKARLAGAVFDGPYGVVTDDALETTMKVYEAGGVTAGLVANDDVADFSLMDEVNKVDLSSVKADAEKAK